MHDEDNWRHWARFPYCPAGRTSAADLPGTSFLPPLQRRRLSPLARMVFDCAWPLADGLDPMPIVFASRHGETNRNFAQLQTLAAGEPLSPTAFGLSVHNAIVGQWSIIRKETAEGVALAGEADMLEHAFIEACALLRADSPRVLVVAAEERPPADYAHWITDVPFSYAAAFRVGNAPQWRVEPDATPAAAAVDDEPDWPHPLNLLRHLINETPAWRHDRAARRWTWTRHRA
ncbi:beta-ketoacyl synthase chain length factor [Pseudothauera rhizosphaerae]|uniref:beta-ketoacyl synthase chain length factor n=1 Tax=Pseudothauera rhizosphaerae TaxID=2565932 RepID=UPI001B3B2372|nr:beta-ketoacyl synthase chain length factor [Pseudothauera rhizosphaerae]